MNPTNENTIRALLRRFMDGETSLDDERLLAEYFRDHPVPEDLPGSTAVCRRLQRRGCAACACFGVWP